MIQKITYFPKGVCSAKMEILVNDEDDTIVDFNVLGGCPGNLGGLRRLMTGMKVKDVADKLDGVCCGGKNTSCPDQLSKALHEYLSRKGA